MPKELIRAPARENTSDFKTTHDVLTAVLLAYRESTNTFTVAPGDANGFLTLALAPEDRSVFEEILAELKINNQHLELLTDTEFE